MLHVCCFQSCTHTCTGFGVIVHVCRTVKIEQCVHPLFCIFPAHICSYSTHICMCTIYMQHARIWTLDAYSMQASFLWGHVRSEYTVQIIATDWWWQATMYKCTCVITILDWMNTTIFRHENIYKAIIHCICTCINCTLVQYM